MIISPNARVTTNVLHAVDNAYRCVDLVYLFGESEEDCNLWLRRLFWARDPEDPYVAPNFIPRYEVPYILTEKLFGPDTTFRMPENNPNDPTYVADSFPFAYYLADDPLGVYMGMDVISPAYGAWLRMTDPRYVPFNNAGALLESDDAFWKWGMTRSYFPPHVVWLLKEPNPPLNTDSGSIYFNTSLEYVLRDEDLEELDVAKTHVVPVKLGGLKTVRSLLLYRPVEGRVEDEKYAPPLSSRLVNLEFPSDFQLLKIRPAADSFEILARLSELSEFKEHEDAQADLRVFPYELNSTRIFGRTRKYYRDTDSSIKYDYSPVEYVGGIPHVVNLDTPITARELFVRWSGALTHFNLLTVPVVHPKGWTLTDWPTMRYEWPHQREVILKLNPDLDTTGLDLDTRSFEYLGDFSTGIRFLSPRVTNNLIEWEGGYRRGVTEGEFYYREQLKLLNDDPYQNVNIYESKCLLSGDRNDLLGDIWQIRNFGRPPEDILMGELDLPYTADRVQWFSKVRYNKSQSDWTVPALGEPPPIESEYIYYDVRDVGDNRAYVANKRLIGWYYNCVTNSWRSNKGRPSSDNQLRFTITFRDPVWIAGCLNPISVPAIWNKPVFTVPFKEMKATDYGSYLFAQGDYFIDPKLYGAYLVPDTVLIEGREDDAQTTAWELMDEYRLEHFSAHAHTYFSYPKRVKQIRITIQDWYGDSFLDDILDDWFYPVPGTYSYDVPMWEETEAVRTNLSNNDPRKYEYYEADLYRKATHRPSDNWLRDGSFYAKEVLMYDMQVTIRELLSSRSPFRLIDSTSFLTKAKEQVELWKNRDVRSLWNGIYIPPFIFFSGEEETVSSVIADDEESSQGAYVSVGGVEGIPETVGMALTVITSLVSPAAASSKAISWSVTSGNATVQSRKTVDPVFMTEATELSVTHSYVNEINTYNYPYMNAPYGATDAEKATHMAKIAPNFTPITLLATVKNGISPGTDFTAEFTLQVFMPLPIGVETSDDSVEFKWGVLTSTYKYSNSPTIYNRELSWMYKEFIFESSYTSDFAELLETRVIPTPTQSKDRVTTYTRIAKKNIYVRARAVCYYEPLSPPWSEVMLVPALAEQETPDESGL